MYWQIFWISWSCASFWCMFISNWNDILGRLKLFSIYCFMIVDYDIFTDPHFLVHCILSEAAITFIVLVLLVHSMMRNCMSLFWLCSLFVK
jgi:hypothetical protein